MIELPSGNLAAHLSSMSMASELSRPRHLLSIGDLRAGQIDDLLRLAIGVKAARDRVVPALRSWTIVMLFERPSLRTRLSIEIAAQHLGGHSIMLPLGEVSGLDISRLWREIGTGIDLVALRVERHATLKDFADHVAVPVLNARSDLEHPCQVLADLLTIREVCGRLEGVRVAFVGEGSSILNSLVLASCQTGLVLRIASPKEAMPSAHVIDAAVGAGADVTVLSDPLAAVEGADVVYASAASAAVGPSSQYGSWRRYQVNAQLLSSTSNAVVMHAMPAIRGREITADVIDGPRSIVLQQAENRLHMQKAILLMLLDNARRLDSLT